MLHRILFDDKPAEGGDTTPKAVQPVLKPSIAKEAPEAMKKMTFSVDEYEPEQLPVHTTLTDADGKPITETKKYEKPKETKPVEVVDEKKTVVVDKPADEERTEEAKPKEEKKDTLPSFLKPPGAKKDDKPTEGKEVIKQIKPDKIVRDYAGHTAEEVSAFKAMSDESYAFAKKVLKENKELQKLKDSTYLQHENAYLLDPQYRSLQQDIQDASKEAEGWKEQLSLMKSGKKWRPLVSYDKNGNLVYGEERDPNDLEEEEVRRLMNQAYQIAHSKNGELQTYPTKYQSQTKNDLLAIEEERKKRFAWVANPELMEYSMHVEGLGDRTFKQMREDFISIFPPYLHANPGVQVAADLMIALRYSQAELEEERAKNKIADIKAAEATRAEPTSKGRIPTDSKKAVHGVTEFSGEPI